MRRTLRFVLFANSPPGRLTRNGLTYGDLDANLRIEMREQPVFNLFYPCGLPFQELDDYP